MNTKLLNRLIDQTVITILFLPVTCFAVPPLAVDVNPIAFPVDLQLLTPQLAGVPKTNFGSGFFFRRETNLFIVTAKHVIFNPKSTVFYGPAATCTAYGTDKHDKRKLVLGLDLLEIAAKGRVLFDTNDHDVAALKIGAIPKSGTGVDFLSGAKLLQSCESSIFCLDQAWSRKFDQIEPAQPVFVFGFPRSVGIADRPQFDSDRPLLRHGIVSGTFPSKSTFVIDAPVYQGNSGGPVIYIEDEPFARRFWLIGVVTQFVPWVEVWHNEKLDYQNVNVSNSGYSVVEPMDVVMQITN